VRNERCETDGAERTEGRLRQVGWQVTLER
jgi:hypothetical protein